MTNRGHFSNRSGQAVVMVGIGLIAMSGLMGLAVDLGWSYFMQKMAQAAADSAALAAVNKAYDMYKAGSTIDCTSLTCSVTPSPCPSSGNLDYACQYAKTNGFDWGAAGGRINVQVNSDAPSPPAAPPTVPGVIVHYWATARVSNTVPQLFSFVLGNTEGTVSARATAAIADSIVNGSLLLIDKWDTTCPGSGACDPVQMGQNQNQCPIGTDLCILGGGNGTNLSVPQGVILASETPPNLNSGSATVVGNAYTAGNYSAPGGWSGTFTQASGVFNDPMSGKGQPPLPTSLPVIPVLGNTISTATTGCQSGVCPPGIYMAMGNAPSCTINCTPVPTGEQLKVSTDITFSGGSWGDYVFYGGLSVSGNVQLGPGRFVMAGAGTDAAQTANNCAPPCQTALNISGSLTGTSSSDAGRMILMTDSTYPGLSSLFTNGGYAPQQLPFGTAVVDGNGATVNLAGLNRNNLPAGLSDELSTFAPAVFWQDQRSSPTLYNANGSLNTACGQPTCPNTGTPTPFSYAQASVEIKNANVTLTGMFYQPEGTWLFMDPGNGNSALGSLSGQVSLITGAFLFKGSTNISLLGSAANNPPLKQIVALIE